MPLDCKPPVAAAKSRFSKAFDDDFVVMLRGIKSRTLEYMQTNAIEVEENLMALGKMKRKDDNKTRKREDTCDSSSYQTIDMNIDMMMKTMERLMERLVVDHRQAPR